MPKWQTHVKKIVKAAMHKISTLSLSSELKILKLAKFSNIDKLSDCIVSPLQYKEVQESHISIQIRKMADIIPCITSVCRSTQKEMILCSASKESEI